MRKTTKDSKEVKASPLAENGKVEMNLVEFPISTLNQKDSRDVIDSETWITDKHGNRLHQKWSVGVRADVGLPNATGYDALIALMGETMEQGVPQKLSFSRYKLLKKIGMTTDKDSYKRLDDQLRRLASITIFSEQAFWDNVEKERITTEEAYHVFDKLWIRKRDKHGNLPKEESYIIWSEPFWKNMKSGYVMLIDNEIFFGTLKRPISKRLYCLLAMKFWKRNWFEIDIFTLASKLGMIVYKYPSQLLQKLKPGIDELIEIGFLSSAEVVRHGKYTRMRFIKGKTEKQLEQKTTEEELSPAIVLSPPSEDRIQPKKTWKEVWHDKAQAYDITAEYRELWLEVLSILETQLNKGSFLTFVADTFLLSIEDDTATVLVSNSFSQDWLKRQMRKQFGSTLNLLLRPSGKRTVSTVQIVPATEAS